MKRDYKFELAQDYSRRGQNKHAIALLKEILSEDPNDALAHGLLAACLISEVRLHAGEYELKIALGLNPMLPYLHLIAARINLLKNLPKQAIKSCDIALSITPEFYDALLFKSSALMVVEKRAEALDCIYEASKISPNSIEVITSFGEYYLSTGDLKKASEHTLEALKIDAEDESANILMGEIQLRNGNAIEAEYHAKLIIRNNPDSRRALQLFCNIKMRKNLFLGLWWKFNSWAATLSSVRAGLVLIVAYLSFNLASQIFKDIGYSSTSIIVSYTWLLIVVYSWAGIPMYYKALKSEMQKFSFNEDF